MPKVSVIVPVYQVEKELDRCLGSICGQTERDIEILCVYTRSADRTYQKLQAWAQRDGRLKILVRNDGGLGGARNTGIEHAQGSYLMFVDSDDWIEPNMVGLLYAAAQKYGAQIAECSFRHVYQDHVQPETACTGDEVEANKWEALESCIDWGRFKAVAWNKLYARQTIGDIRYPLNRLHEDEYTTYKFFYNAQKLVYIDLPLYNYSRMRQNSLTQLPFNEGCLDACFAARERAVFFDEHPDTALLRKKANNVYVWLAWNRLYRAAKHKVSGPRTRQLLEQLQKDLHFFAHRKMGLRYRVQLCLLAHGGPRIFGYGKSAKQ